MCVEAWLYLTNSSSKQVYVEDELIYTREHAHARTHSYLYIFASVIGDTKRVYSGHGRSTRRSPLPSILQGMREIGDFRGLWMRIWFGLVPGLSPDETF
jgi:hypothetical protein